MIERQVIGSVGEPSVISLIIFSVTLHSHYLIGPYYKTVYDWFIPLVTSFFVADEIIRAMKLESSITAIYI